MNIIFFGSFQHYSTLILQSLHQHPDIKVQGVITTPPMPAGRKQTLTPTHTHTWAKEHNIPIFTPEKLNHASLQNLKSNIQHPDLFIVAGYGKILPPAWLTYPKYGSLNIHFSLLPKYRGANPAEWAILMGETQTGISLITMNPKIDAGDIITQHAIKITPQDNRETLYTRLYSLSARYSSQDILKYYHWLQKKDANCQTSLAPHAQKKTIPPYARLLKRDDGFLPWSTISKAISGPELTANDFQTPLFRDILTHLSKNPSKALTQEDFIQLINRSSRAFYSYPGLWTIAPTIKGDKRLKIHTTSLYKNHLKLDTVQLEGHVESSFNSIKNQIRI